ncbi:MAG: penicillin-binding transpeptidase domain-containing protein [Eubacteriaceae bacterium]|nr:penicillin-binding transpeptidase domain-containing protein [Eubacteriaceae bacterium]
MGKISGKNKKRILMTYAIVSVLIIALSLKVAWIQIVKAEEYTEKAVEQQTSDIPIEAKRGTITDRNGKELASSATCYSVWVWPAYIKDHYTTDAKLDEVASQLAVALDKKSKEIKKELTADQALVRIAKGLEKEEAEKIRKLDIYGLEIAENTKRYYPLGNFASQLLGSVNDDGVGRTGVESMYDEYLSGVAGRWIKNTDIQGNDLSYGQEEYYQAEDGLNVVLTIDEILQHYAENAIAKGMKSTKAKRIMCLVLDVKTGDVLAMATNPGFDPNNATEPDSKSEKKEYDKMSDKEQSEYLSRMWRNPVVSDVYEPGSTWKLITTSAALESGAATMNSSFYCDGSYHVPGTNITLHCLGNHGSQSLKEAVGNSCNPAQMKMGMAMGKSTYEDFLNMFGITQKTGIDLEAESTAIIQKNIGPVELCTMSYGQGIAVTPIQLASAVAAIGNDGVLMQPRVVKKLTNSDGETVKNFETQAVRKVLSSKTANEMKKIMEYVVSEGGGSGAQIAGYRIGGKTGTADKAEDGQYRGNTYSSFIGMAPMDDPKFVCLVVVDSPQGVRYGGLIAAPIAKDFMENALPYLNISPSYTKSESKKMSSQYSYVPNVTGKKVSKAIEILEECDLKYEIVPKRTDDEEFTVVDQYPKKGKKINKKGTVYLYRE